MEKYTIRVSPGEKLLFSFIGYTSQESTVGASATIDVKLKSAVQAVDEVTVTAEFGMKRVARAIGSSVQNVKASDIVDSGRDNFVSALQGRVAGMTVTSSGGAPGSSTTVVFKKHHVHFREQPAALCGRWDPDEQLNFRSN